MNAQEGLLSGVSNFNQFFLPRKMPLVHGRQPTTFGLPSGCSPSSNCRRMLDDALRSSHPDSKGDPKKYIRRFKRYGVDKRIRVFAGEREDWILNGRCNVLSEAGFGAVIAGQLPPTEIVTIEFALDKIEGLPFRLRAEVRYCRGFDHGFEFVAPTAAQKMALGDLFADSVQVG